VQTIIFFIPTSIYTKN